MARLFDTPESLPFRFTMTHYHVFDRSVSVNAFKDGKLDSAESWDLLREKEPMFSVPETRDEWIEVMEHGVRKDGQDARLKERGILIADRLTSEGITSLVSFGSGGAGLEYHIHKRLPGLRIVCSEYAPKTVMLLQQVFSEAEVVQFDLMNDSFDLLTQREDATTTLELIYRLDAQFSDSQWKEIFEKMHQAGVKNVLFIPTGFLTLRSLLSRIRQRIIWKMQNKQAVFSGYLRTKKTFVSYWDRHFSATEQVLAGMTGFWLQAK